MPRGRNADCSSADCSALRWTRDVILSRLVSDSKDRHSTSNSIIRSGQRSSLLPIPVQRSVRTRTLLSENTGMYRVHRKTVSSDVVLALIADHSRIMSPERFTSRSFSCSFIRYRYHRECTGNVKTWKHEESVRTGLGLVGAKQKRASSFSFSEAWSP